MKRLVAVGVVVLALVVAVWYGVRASWFGGDELPNNPPTADELERIQEIERTSSEISPTAVPGAGVVPPGTPVPEPVTPPTTEATSTDADDVPQARIVDPIYS
jgi:hypothetical protein